MSNNNYSQNNFSNNDDCESILTNKFITQERVMNDTYVPATYSNNINNADQQPISNQQYDALSDIYQNHQQSTSNGNNNITISPDHNHQQYDSFNHNQQSTSNCIFNNSHYQQYDSNNISRHNYQKFYPQHINQNLPQSNIFHINSPQTNIIVIPATNSDIQNHQLQQVYAYLNHSFNVNN
ncbi:hypothetical protein RhiirA5_414576 [Rhizophagus irregularis]|uniref:Uncharacterized protein n=3 Tax=Rhizophagus irregularis TaxID=588596 RepID=A0A2I1EQ57_9GLOM|nr:hypothetical protein GLOIN_2v1761139 [Rhizophagus irregularis DAOM 181602=DAOM 197198]EXX73983.1 hypothetical protein RirG_055320 [Rhizophagus irregularis DAOM 197198w]PKC10275.1 hypothetical protein RhiirA5_414576 [Rhizophagus irregularis]PKC72513.1 hypothetical protein RhiirA1_452241 [Rhizophagus irregularis]PKY24253.1 hypothetical protein RhiirB3_438732 [Rhizophagus irregularis]POG83131.1 hypothetical protein GLOIN_2v1761139 [Rhizophagus irregularis DAOM 181602=DAOM 197198]|eukprot:XP_025189997.1 hypothetical protein GLOIN_2v1761139 [Rhizophagus irregularis DAOM 181602=DAOM 197198]